MMKNSLSSPAYDRNIELMLKHHRARQADSEADYTDEELDELEALWPSLSDAQQQSLRGLSADLNSLLRGHVLTPKELSEEEKTVRRRALESCKGVAAWHDFFKELRYLAPFLPFQEVCLARSKVWERLGQPQLALEFMRAASKANPNAEGYAFNEFKLLAQADLAGALQQAKELLERRTEFNLERVLFASGLVFRQMGMRESKATADGAARYLNLQKIAMDAIRQLRGQTGPQAESLMGLAAWLAVGTSYWLGDLGPSRPALKAALAEFPENPTLNYLALEFMEAADSGSSPTDIDLGAHLLYGQPDESPNKPQLVSSKF